MTRWLWVVVVVAACGSKKQDDPGTGTGTGTGSAAPVDTSSWSQRELASLGVEAFSFPATIKLPPGAETQTTALYGNDGARIGVVAYVDLPGGVRVNLAERAKNAVNDPDMLLQFMRSKGTLVVDRREPTWFMIAVETDQGIELQGQFWAVRPGISCSTQKPVTADQLAQVTAMCATFAPGLRP
jgi:hypothetical protein